MTGKADLAASVSARLLNRAKETGDDHQTLLTGYLPSASSTASAHRTAATASC